MEFVDGVKYLYSDEVAEELGVSPSRIRQILLSGELVAEKVGGRYRGYWRILPEQVENYKKVRKGPGKPKK